MRGKPELAESARAAIGITPAGAGKTLLFFGGQYVVRDHPRRCGENPLTFLSRLRPMGSPPQVRGKRGRAKPYRATDRITPAGAGKTLSTALYIPFTKDHPRRCGENSAFTVDDELPVGSPPQVRGKPFSDSVAAVNTGITPAGAGKTKRIFGLYGSPTDHPRRCGENSFIIRIFQAKRGSPPQVRGKQFSSLIKINGIRITPAGAGKTKRCKPNFHSG